MIFSLLRLALRRLLAQRGLALASGVGLIVSVALVTSIPLYADATQFRIMREQIGGDPARATADAPLAFYFQYAAKPRNSPQWADAAPLDDYLSRLAQRTVGLPQTQVIRLFRTDAFKLFPPPDPDSTDTEYFLTYINLAFLNSPQATTRLIAGTYPAPEVLPEGPIEIAISEAAAAEFGLLVGDAYAARRDDGPEIPVRVVGIWAPNDPQADYWDVRAGQLALAAEAAYINRVSPLIEDELFGAAWFVVLDGSRLHASDIAPLPGNIQAMQNRAETLLPDIKLEARPWLNCKSINEKRRR